MTVLLVVPLEELLAEGATVLDAAEAVWEVGPVLQGSELAFGIRVVVGDVGPAVSLGDAQVGHEKGDRLGGHDPAAVGVNVELASGNLMLADGFVDEPRGQFGALAGSHHPTGDVAAEDVEDDVEIKVGPFDRPQQLGDVPAPKLVRCRGQQLRFLVRRMHELITTLAGFSFLFENPVHGANRAEILSFIQQGGLYSRGGAVLKSLFM